MLIPIAPLQSNKFRHACCVAHLDVRATRKAENPMAAQPIPLSQPKEMAPIGDRDVSSACESLREALHRGRNRSCRQRARLHQPSHELHRQLLTLTVPKSWRTIVQCPGIMRVPTEKTQ